MKQSYLCTMIIALASLLFMGSEVRAQGDVPRYEIGGQVSLLSLNSPSSQTLLGLSPFSDNPCKEFDLICARVETGVGARFTYNLTNHVALEAEGNLFPGRPLNEFEGFSPGGVPAGRTCQVQFGVKAGKRFKKFGLFLKARPGFVTFTEASQFTGFRLRTFFHVSQGRNVHLENAEFRTGKATYLSTDLGGVLEFYPSRRIVTRFDIGDTLIRYGIYRERLANVCPLCCPCPSELFERPAETRHNLQFSAGIAIRF